jgi:ferredoxin
MTPSKDIFDELSERLGAPGSKHFPRILKAMMTPEEANILLLTPTPTPAQEIAAKLNTDVKTLQPMLDDMEQRQVIRRAGPAYVSPGNIVAFHHGAIGWIRQDLIDKVYPMWGDFFFEEWRDILVDGFIERKKKGALGAHRVVPAYKALRASPNIKPEQILWYEDMEQVLRRSERITFMMCGCRGLWRKCDNPIETCLQVQFPTGQTRKRELGEFIKPPRDVTFEEAMAIIDNCEDLGLVHIPLNTSHGDLFCNCCDDCCMVINPMLHRGGGVIWDILSPSRYRAVVNQELCSGCQTCVERCKFDAIEMQPVPGTKKLKSKVINEHCLGCGACVVKCPKGAVTLELVRPPEHIPTVSVMELFSMGQGS